jgi:ABC-type amino acid transport substrate-binding protein
MSNTKSLNCLIFLICLTSPVLASGQPLRYNLEEKRWLDQHKEVRIGVVEQNLPLLSYAGGNNPQGLVADYLRALTPHLGLQLEVTRYPDLTQLANALLNGEVDVVGAWPIGWKRVGPVLLSRPYLSFPAALYGLSEVPSVGLPSLHDKTLAVLQGSVWEGLAQIAPGLKTSSYPSLEQALQAAADGRVYAYLGDAASADYLLKRRSFGDLELQKQLDLNLDLALATRVGDVALLGLLQKGLERIVPEEMEEIWRRWPGVERPPQYEVETPSMLLWLPLSLAWSALLVWGVHRYFAHKERLRRARLKMLIQRFQRRERRHKEKLQSLKRLAQEYQGETEQQRHRLTLIEEVLPSAAWVWEPSVSQCQWDERMYDLYQQDREEFEPTPEAILERVHEADRAQVAVLFRPPDGNDESRLSYRVALPDGSIRWLLDFSYYSVDQATGTEQRVGLCWDITDYVTAMPRVC